MALVAGVLLAVAATAVLVLTDDLALLRLAVVGALWAFLIAAFVAGNPRPSPEVASTELTLRRTHELELDREVALRREAELNVEVRVRREVEGALREDIAGLRGDLLRLREDILQRWDGELRVERVAVRSESTRVSGFGASFHALQDEARRLAEQGRPLFEVEAGQGTLDQRTVLVPTADALPGMSREPDSASTVEFVAVPAEDTPEQERTGPVRGLPVSPELRPPARSRHHVGDDAGAEDAADLVRRLSAETTGEIPVITDQTTAPRRRRARDDDETNDVLTRVLGER